MTTLLKLAVGRWAILITLAHTRLHRSWSLDKAQRCGCGSAELLVYMFRRKFALERPVTGNVLD